MLYHNVGRWGGFIVLMFTLLACTLARQTPMPAAEVEQINFEIQTATPTVGFLVGAPTDTPDPDAMPTPRLTATIVFTATSEATTTAEIVETLATIEPELEQSIAPEPEAAQPTLASTVPAAAPLRGGVWSFEDGFAEWRNPFGDACPGSGLANGWSAFTTQDQFGSSCMNKTDWPGNVQSGESAQEITFAYVGVEAGIFRTAATVPGHRYTVEAYMKREFSPAILEVFLGIDITGGTDWQADSVQWFPWDEDLDDQWARTEETVTAAGETMTIFIKGSHPYPEPGGTLRLDSVSIVDVGQE